MIMDDTVTVPEGYDPDSFEIISEEDSEQEEHMCAAVQAASVFESIATAFGTPAVEGTNRSQEIRTRYFEFLATGARAMTVQQNRNKRRF